MSKRIRTVFFRLPESYISEQMQDNQGKILLPRKYKVLVSDEASKQGRVLELRIPHDEFKSGWRYNKEIQTYMDCSSTPTYWHTVIYEWGKWYDYGSVEHREVSMKKRKKDTDKEEARTQGRISKIVQELAQENSVLGAEGPRYSSLVSELGAELMRLGDFWDYFNRQMTEKRRPITHADSCKKLRYAEGIQALMRFWSHSVGTKGALFPQVLRETKTNPITGTDIATILFGKTKLDDWKETDLDDWKETDPDDWKTDLDDWKETDLAVPVFLQEMRETLGHQSELSALHEAIGNSIAQRLYRNWDDYAFRIQTPLQHLMDLIRKGSLAAERYWDLWELEGYLDLRDIEGSEDGDPCEVDYVEIERDRRSLAYTVEGVLTESRELYDEAGEATEGETTRTYHIGDSLRVHMRELDTNSAGILSIQYAPLPYAFGWSMYFSKTSNGVTKREELPEANQEIVGNPSKVSWALRDWVIGVAKSPRSWSQIKDLMKQRHLEYTRAKKAGEVDLMTSLVLEEYDNT